MLIPTIVSTGQTKWLWYDDYAQGTTGWTTTCTGSTNGCRLRSVHAGKKNKLSSMSSKDVEPGSNCNVAHRHNSSREALWRRWWSAEDQKVHRRHWNDSVGRTTQVRWGQTGCEKEYNWSRSAWSNDSKQHPHKFLEYYTPIRLERHIHHQNGRPIYSDLATTGLSQSSLREVNWSSTHRYFKARSWPFLTRFRY